MKWLQGECKVRVSERRGENNKMERVSSEGIKRGRAGLLLCEEGGIFEK